MASIRGVDNTIDNSASKGRNVDTRTIWQKIFTELPSYDLYCLTTFVVVFVIWQYTVASILLIPFVLLIFFMSKGLDNNTQLPMKIPFTYNKLTDKRDHKPGQENKYEKARGTIFLGRTRLSMRRRELWATSGDFLTHLLFMGTTGAGKTESLVSLCTSMSFMSGGGLIYVDAKGSIKLYRQIHTLAKIFGRVDQLRLINFTAVEESRKFRSMERTSNTNNPFSNASANESSQILTALFESGDGGGENSVFEGRAKTLTSVVLSILSELREQGALNITPSRIAEFAELDKLLECYRDKIKLDGVEINAKISEKSKRTLNNYFKSLPNFDYSKEAAEQAEQVGNQHTFGLMYLTEGLVKMSSTFSNIFETELPEADFRDILTNGRIAVIIVPAIGLSTSEKQTLGKITLSGMKTAMTALLGDKAEGKAADVVDSLPVDLEIPNLMLVDEYAEVATPGFAVTSTQCRSLALSCTFSGQDLAGFMKASKEETLQIMGNTNHKFLMKLEEVEETFKAFNAIAGEEKVAVQSGWDWEKGVGSPRIGSAVQSVDKSRISLRDLQEQKEGQAHIFESGNIWRAQLFHHGIFKLVDEWRLNTFVPVKKPSLSQIELLREQILFRVNKNTQIQMKTENKPFSSRISKLLASKIDDQDNDWAWKYLLSRHENNAEPLKGDDFKTRKRKEVSSLMGAVDEDTSVGEDVGSLGAEAVIEAASDDDLFDAFDAETNNDDQDTMESGSTYAEEDSSETIDTTEFGDSDSDEDIINSMASVEEADLDERSSNGDNAEDLGRKVKDVISKAENSWIFESLSLDTDTNSANSLFEMMSESLSAIGYEEAESLTVASNNITRIAESASYPSSETLSKHQPSEETMTSLTELISQDLLDD